MHTGLSLLVFLTLGALDDSERQTLFARVKHSVVILRQTTLTGDRVAHGTGWVVRADGLLVTNSHVAELSHQMEAVFADGQAVPVEGVVYDDPEHDLAEHLAKPARSATTFPRLNVWARWWRCWRVWCSFAACAAGRRGRTGPFEDGRGTKNELSK